MAEPWSPKRSLLETDSLLCAPGTMHEMETRLVDGRLQRVYRNLWPSSRDFWLSSVAEHGPKTYIVEPGRQRTTYQQLHEQAMETANLFYRVYGIRKECKLLFVDAERADRLEPALDIILGQGYLTGVLVITVNDKEHSKRWRGMENLCSVLNEHLATVNNPLPAIEINPEDNAVIMFTSGTTGLPKGVLSTQRQFLTNILNTLVGNRRAVLRRGEDLAPVQDAGPQKGALVAVPLFHVTGLTSYSMMATMLGYKIVLMRKWIPEEASRLITEENIGVAGGVPAMVQDIMDACVGSCSLEGLFFGGSPAPNILVETARKVFPNTSLSQAYGLTETNSIAVAIAGDDYNTRPTSTQVSFYPSHPPRVLTKCCPHSGIACPVNDMIVMSGNTIAPAGTIGEIWLRGPNVMKGYWKDPEATNKVLTSDGWLKTGDIGMMDEEGFLYVKDRIKDIIIRGGENIASIAVENVLYMDSRIMEAAAVGVPDPRLGELVTAVVSVKSPFRGTVTENSLIELARKKLPRFAVPVMIIVRDEPFELTPSGKIMKAPLRQLAKQYWEDRLRSINQDKARANL
ncbi:hypothetical protein V5O48_006234 [Marasmius crinis-equi]|uniref:Uncharacterized protein n=1 Tax=Marasmius crinis-equi TaxID=585013 RepID=A0ABR3FK31_9AGAR